MKNSYLLIFLSFFVTPLIYAIDNRFVCVVVVSEDSFVAYSSGVSYACDSKHLPSADVFTQALNRATNEIEGIEGYEEKKLAQAYILGVIDVLKIGYNETLQQSFFAKTSRLTGDYLNPKELR
jgi:hypothetical protein